MLVFLLQKRSRLQFDDFDEEGMTNLLEAGLLIRLQPWGQSHVVEEAQAEPLSAWTPDLGGLPPCH